MSRYIIQMPSTIPPSRRRFLSHSAKGSTWDDHKYIKKEDDKYYYPDSYEGGRHLPDGESSNDSNDTVDTKSTNPYDDLKALIEKLEGKKTSTHKQNKNTSSSSSSSNTTTSSDDETSTNAEITSKSDTQTSTISASDKADLFQNAMNALVSSGEAYDDPDEDYSGYSVDDFRDLYEDILGTSSSDISDSEMNEIKSAVTKLKGGSN